MCAIMEISFNKIHVIRGGEYKSRCFRECQREFYFDLLIPDFWHRRRTPVYVKNVSLLWPNGGNNETGYQERKVFHDNIVPACGSSLTLSYLGSAGLSFA